MSTMAWSRYTCSVLGSGTMTVGDDRREVLAGTLVFVPPGMRHSIRNDGHEMLVYVSADRSALRAAGVGRRVFVLASRAPDLGREPREGRRQVRGRAQGRAPDRALGRHRPVEHAHPARRHRVTRAGPRHGLVVATTSNRGPGGIAGGSRGRPTAIRCPAVDLRESTGPSGPRSFLGAGPLIDGHEQGPPIRAAEQQAKQPRSRSITCSTSPPSRTRTHAVATSAYQTAPSASMQMPSGAVVDLGPVRRPDRLPSAAMSKAVSSGRRTPRRSASRCPA